MIANNQHRKDDMQTIPNFEKLDETVGWNRTPWREHHAFQQLQSYINLRLTAAGLLEESDLQLPANASFSRNLLDDLRTRDVLLDQQRAPIDQRISAFLNRYFADQDLPSPLQVPANSFVLDRYGMARELSLPRDGDHFVNELVESHRCRNGILNNPASDRRTTSGTFHICAGGLPIPMDKREVPKQAFVGLFNAALAAPQDLLKLPYTSELSSPAATWVSLLLRPLVCPEVPGYCREKRMEIRFFVPGSLISNLDFVESIFGNAGNPLSPLNDAALDIEQWSGHTGCVILAPHLTKLTKQSLGLPHISEATSRQVADRMCWTEPDERYNDGGAFKLTCRDDAGVVVTLIADNYYGYCKKEVKTQISYAANLMGGVEEEHAGGALAFASYSLGEEFQVNSRRYNGRTFAEVARDYADFIDVRAQGYGVDINYQSIIYIPENAFVSLPEKCVKWNYNGPSGDSLECSIPLNPHQVYIAPSGFQIRLEKHPKAPSWRLIGTVGEGIFCHKPCTVSGGGKSEISKSLRDYMIYGPIVVANQQDDFLQLNQIFNFDYQQRWNPSYKNRPSYDGITSRRFLDPNRSLGSVIKMLTPSPDFSDQYNQWLAEIPNHIYAMALIIKRFIKPGMEDHWKEIFGVDIVNGVPGHELKMQGRRLIGTYLRVGLTENQWRTFKLRQDFAAATKVQMEDDISVSVVVPSQRLANLGAAVANAHSHKFAANCEYRLFQRPDDAVHRGLDKMTEQELAQPGNFISNFQPISHPEVCQMVADVIDFDLFSDPMKQLLIEFNQSHVGGESDSTKRTNDIPQRTALPEGRSADFVVSSAHPRLVDGAPTKNPRYLQDRPDLVQHRQTYVSNVGVRLARALPADQSLYFPVGASLAGRRNNPPDLAAGIRGLSVYSPLHYQEIPELLMDYISSLTGKSPSTTGAGSEGALTKGPFNMLVPTVDLNNALISMILTGVAGFSTPAGHIGSEMEVGHDISLLIPEIWCRMGPEERDPQTMIDNGMLEKIEDYQFENQRIPASRLGYRITRRFLRHYVSRVFDSPALVFTEEILKPELHDPHGFADSVLHIAQAQAKVAQRYFDDGSYEMAVPPLQAILSIMAKGDWQGHDLHSPAIRSMFTLEYLLESDWYQKRLRKKQHVDIEHWQHAIEYLESYIAQPSKSKTTSLLALEQRLEFAKQQLQRVNNESFLEELVGTLGRDPMLPIPPVG